MSWKNNVSELFSVIVTLLMSKWCWVANSRCKYISIRIDMRDGKYLLMDRDGEEITVDELRHQDKL